MRGPRREHRNKRASPQQLGPTTSRRAWSGMAETACYPSNTFCGPIQGEWKTKTDIVQSPIYGLAAGVATMAILQLGMNWLYRLAMVQLSHQSLRKLLVRQLHHHGPLLIAQCISAFLCLECLVPTTAIIRQTCE